MYCLFPPFPVHEHAYTYTMHACSCDKQQASKRTEMRAPTSLHLRTADDSKQQLHIYHLSSTSTSIALTLQPCSMHFRLSHAKAHYF